MLIARVGASITLRAASWKNPHRGFQITICNSLTRLVAACGTRAARAARDGFGFARDTATAFNVFFWLQITNFDVSLLRSAPNRPDHIDIGIFGLFFHRQLFRSNVSFRMAD
jgi:hypothetical protein